MRASCPSATTGRRLPDRPHLVPRAGVSEGEAARYASSSGDVRPDPAKFQASYYPLHDNFTANLKDSGQFVQVGLGVSTYYDERVLDAVKLHEMAVRSAILMTLNSADAARPVDAPGQGAAQGRAPQGDQRRPQEEGRLWRHRRRLFHEPGHPMSEASSLTNEEVDALVAGLNENEAEAAAADRHPALYFRHRAGAAARRDSRAPPDERARGAQAARADRADLADQAARLGRSRRRPPLRKLEGRAARIHQRQPLPLPAVEGRIAGRDRARAGRPACRCILWRHRHSW